MPIHQTKLTMAKPQATGTLIPQMPTPLKSNQAIVKKSICTSRKVPAKPSSQRRVVFLPRTMELIFSVTEPNVYPGPMIGASVGTDGLFEVSVGMYQASSGLGLRTAARYVV